MQQYFTFLTTLYGHPYFLLFKLRCFHFIQICTSVFLIFSVWGQTDKVIYYCSFILHSWLLVNICIFDTIVSELNFYFILFVLWDRVMLCRLGWTQILNSLSSASWVLQLQVCATTSSLVIWIYSSMNWLQLSYVYNSIVLPSFFLFLFLSLSLPSFLFFLFIYLS
jgi:hypothetical protein